MSDRTTTRITISIQLEISLCEIEEKKNDAKHEEEKNCDKLMKINNNG